jgi:uncharacterized protein YkwD
VTPGSLHRWPLFSLAAAAIFIVSCNTQGVSNLLPEHARETLGGANSTSPPASPSAATAPQSSGSDSWLARLNYFRAMAGLNSVSDDTKMSAGDVMHARYLVKNNSGRPNPGLDMHLESSKNRWYTPEGYAAGRTSDVIPPNGIELTGQQAIDIWIEGPFHRFPILNPALKEVGFGVYSEDGETAIAMQIRKPGALDNPLVSPSHRSFINDESETPSDEGAPPRPIEFPPPNSRFPLASFSTGEWPNPLASCAGYQRPSGFPITLQLGSAEKPKLQSATLTSEGRTVESCAIDASSYRGDDQTMTYAGQASLENFGAIIVVPRERLHSGATYEVSIVADGKTYQWSFTIEGSSNR